ncbi:hypothetical protein ABT174_35035 [Streptomyces sparsogenes]|uniref:hypothetical protein n=1 Tax=Streptomyces sparsogenes TaxID=67365 RepID=UPI00332E6F06
MTHDLANSVLATAVALRVFTPDAMALARRLLGAGVRVGVAALLERRSDSPAVSAGRQDGGNE